MKNNVTPFIAPFHGHLEQNEVFLKFKRLCLIYYYIKSPPTRLGGTQYIVDF